MSKKKQESNVIDQEEDVMEAAVAKATPEKLAIEDMPLNSVRDYRLYNEEARRLNKKLKICRYPLKPCPVELHPKQRVIFSRNDQPSNPLPVYLSNSIIHYKETLVPGKTYDLPEYIVHYLSEKGYPIWDWFTNKDGSKETRIVNKDPRFSLRTVYREQ
jgi:hypothetical protein